MSGFERLEGDLPSRLRARNRRTALILASIAVVFFVGILIKFSLQH